MSLRAVADLLRSAGYDVAQHHDDGVAVSGVTLSTDRVLPGDLYAALSGTRAHGADFAPAALAAGAGAVLTDDAGAARLPAGTPALVVPRPRQVLGKAAARVYGEPSARLVTIGVTGTQGKTTTTQLLEGALQRSGTTAAVVGTVGTRIAGAEVPSLLTTPEAPDLQGLLARMVEEQVEACALEVSSHALVLGRVDGIIFDVAVFTNLGRDHLDFHADLDDYYNAKASLFTPARARLGLINVDDEHGRRLVEDASVPVRTLSASGREADWRASDVQLEADGSRFTVLSPAGESIAVEVQLPGAFNVANALAAVAAAGEAGLDPRRAATGLAAGAGVPGRLEKIDTDRDFTVVVDYAHKPDAVAAVLGTLRPLALGRLIVVIGAGGDRDPGKRPLMGEIAARLADLVVITDDNPRTEDPAAIRAAVRAGAAGPGTVIEEGNRRRAIRLALDTAGAGDIVLVAGKGHETGQEIEDVVHPFDDRSVVREELTRQQERG